MNPNFCWFPYVMSRFFWLSPKHQGLDPVQDDVLMKSSSCPGIQSSHPCTMAQMFFSPLILNPTLVGQSIPMGFCIQCLLLDDTIYVYIYTYHITINHPMFLLTGHFFLLNFHFCWLNSPFLVFYARFCSSKRPKLGSPMPISC